MLKIIIGDQPASPVQDSSKVAPQRDADQKKKDELRLQRDAARIVAEKHLASENKRLVIPIGSPGYSWIQKPWLAMGSSSHGDGFAEVEFTGEVVEHINGEDTPLSGVRFSVVGDHSFSSGLNSRVIFLSNEQGKFLAHLFVQSASVGDGKDEGKVYQTFGNRIRIQKDGYATREIWFDYEMPESIIHMEKEKNSFKFEARNLRGRNRPR